ncbi:MAG: alpha-mannosidase [Anaerolineae bacterium]|nr:alpha-mannosidase [Anaerolineae bacterium]
MQKHIELTRQRAQNFSTKLTTLFYPVREPVSIAVHHAPGRIPYRDAMQGDYRPTNTGEKFGPLWSTHWFRVNLEIPSGWQGREVHLLWDSSSEACIWQDGVPLQGLTGSFNGWLPEPVRKELCITKEAHGGESFEFYVEVACNGLFGLDNQAHNFHIGELVQAEIAVFDRDVWNLYWDLKVIADMALHLPANTPRCGQALAAANEMVNTILLNDKSTWPAAHAIAARFFSAHNGGGQHNLSAIGQAHIDTAWLWPIAETKRKCVRTFASATRYMNEYPEYRFACSQAQQLEWMKEQYPELYAGIVEKAHAGQFIPVGGTWVEPDCNIPSGESLVRQFLYGQRFFEAEFGLRCQEFWNPDVFGYSGALPQIMKLAGIDYFLTQKLSWNQFNKPASHTFLWEGIDGSRILTHFPPADTYNSLANVEEVLYSVSNFKDHERANESYLLFGYGDGGGGPTPAMLEQLRRMADVDGLPRTQIRSPHEFFARCAADLKDSLVMVGELYFELHRGTYTSQARNKKFNRQSELLLRDVEMLSALALVTRGLAYPANALQKLWKLVLTNQFHDIIPGSSIGEVYADSTKDYAVVLEQAAALHEKALQALTPGTSAPETDKIFVFNTLGFPRTEVVDLGGRLGLVSAPSLGYAIQTPATTTETVSVTETEPGFILENTLLKAVFNRQGGLTSLLDKSAQRESIEPGQAGNTFVLYEDLPNAWEAWDVDAFHLEKKLVMGGASSVNIVESGPLRAAIAFEYVLSPHSTIRQVVSLDALSARLDFACQVDWREKQKFLKVEFPLNLRASYATYEIQFGHVQRPTHFNTSYDMARFEVPAHKWADLSEPDFGVALLNDCKYGYAAHGNILRLSLLRAPTYPDPQADQGRHQFRFALCPHAGNPQSAGITEAACCFNVPLLTAKSGGQDIQQAFFSLNQPAVLLDTIKKAEDSEALILRLYEARGTRGKLRLTSPLPVQSAALVNLLEDEISHLDWQDGGVELSFKPFEIISMRLTL